MSEYLDSSVSTTESAPAPGTFERKSTGLVRQVSPFSATIFNMLPSAPGVGLAISVFWVLGVYPGAHILAAYWITAVIAVAVALPFAFLVMTMPRSGGDYTLVSRIVSPQVGLCSSMSLMVAQILAIGFFCTLFVSIGLIPGLTTLGLLFNSKGLTDAATTISTHGWTFGLGLAMLIISLLMSAIPLRHAMRIQNVCFAIALGGLVVGTIAMFALSRESFIAGFNHYAGPDAYDRLLRAANRNGITQPESSWANTWPALGAFAFLFCFSWWSANYGGEVRAARRKSTVAAMTVSIVVPIALFTIATAALYHMAGSHFVAAANALNGSKSYPLTVPPYWLVLVSLGAKSTALAIVLVITLLFWFPIWIWFQIAQPVRALWAWAFDGLLPTRVAHVDRRTHSPWTALAIVGALSLGALIWAVYSVSFSTALATITLEAAIPLVLVGVAAVLLPFRKRELWQSSAPVRGRIGPVPTLSLIGAAGVIASALIIFIFLRYPGLGIVHRARSLIVMGAVFVAAFVFYYGASLVNRARGVQIGLNYKEIPPE